MTQDDKIKICLRCKNRKFDLKKGIVCALTNDKPKVDDNCNSFIVDETVLLEEKRRDGSVDGDAPWWVWILVAVAAVVFFVKFYNEHTKEPVRLTVSEILTPTLASINRTLPEKYTTGEVWTRISLDGNVLIYDFKLDQDLSGETGESLEFAMLVTKHNFLSGYNSVTNFDAIDLHECVDEYNLQIAYRYTDMNGNTVPLIYVSEPELRRAVSSKKYKCPVEDIKAIVDYYNTLLPAAYIDGGTLESISFNEESHELLYTTFLPYDNSQMRYLAKKDCEDYIKTEWNNLKDGAIAMIMINEYPMTFVFCSNSGTEYHRVTVEPAQYNKWKN